MQKITHFKPQITKVTCLLPSAPPHILQEGKNVHSFLEDEDVSLPCTVEGTLPLSVVWLLDGVEIQDLKLPGISVEEDSELRENNITQIKVCLHANMFQCLQTWLCRPTKLAIDRLLPVVDCHLLI